MGLLDSSSGRVIANTITWEEERSCVSKAYILPITTTVKKSIGGTLNWGGGTSTSMRSSFTTSSSPVPFPQATVVAPKRSCSALAQHRLDVDGTAADNMWKDSGEDEDEQYVGAKRLLTRAAKRDKEVMRMIAKGKRSYQWTIGETPGNFLGVDADNFTDALLKGLDVDVEDTGC